MVFLQKLTEKLHLEERVHLLGYRTDIPDLLGAADIFCMPSRREGCGMAALEAMAAGLPLITVRNHGTKVYAEKGESAFCLKGDLVTSCADAIAQLAENKLLRRQMGAHNRAAATAFSDKDRMMQLRHGCGHPAPCRGNMASITEIRAKSKKNFTMLLQNRPWRAGLHGRCRPSARPGYQTFCWDSGRRRTPPPGRCRRGRRKNPE